MKTSRRSIVALVLAAPLFLAGCSEAKVSGQTEGGTELAASGQELPKDWPQALAAPEGSEVTSVISEGDVVTASGTSNKEPVALATQFQSSLEADGWTQSSRSSDDNSMVVESWEKGTVSVQVSTMSASDGSTFMLIHNPG